MKENFLHLHSRGKEWRKGKGRQRGLVLEIVLIVLVAMLFASVALFRSVDASSSVAGNIAFKTDASNRAQLAFEGVFDWLKNASNYSTYVAAGTDCNTNTCNYSARMQKTDAQGIPEILSGTTSAFDAVYSNANNRITADGMTVRYLIERMCTQTGAPKTDYCVMSQVAPEGGTQPMAGPRVLGKPVFRVSVRVDGPRNTVAYTQVTVTL